MSEYLEELHSEIEQVILDMDDSLHIAGLVGTDAWDALVRQMAVKEEMALDGLLNTSDPSDFRFLQGGIGALRDVVIMVNSASETANNLQEKLAEKQHEKDEILAQEA